MANMTTVYGSDQVSIEVEIGPEMYKNINWWCDRVLEIENTLTPDDANNITYIKNSIAKLGVLKIPMIVAAHIKTLEAPNCAEFEFDMDAVVTVKL